jgi:hypothetical protein
MLQITENSYRQDTLLTSIAVSTDIPKEKAKIKGTVRLFRVKTVGVRISCTPSPHHEGVQVAHRYTYTHS